MSGVMVLSRRICLLSRWISWGFWLWRIETLKAESVALVESQWRALQLVADQNGLEAALGWQLVEPERLTSAPGML